MCMTYGERAKYDALVDAGVSPTEAWNRVFNRTEFPESPSEADVETIVASRSEDKGLVGVGV